MNSFQPSQTPASKESSVRRLYGFGKEKRLLKKRDFDVVFQDGYVLRDGRLSVYNRPNGLGYSRLGLMVSRKLGRANRRNRVKRLFREAFRLNQYSLPAGFDLIVVPSASFEDDSLQEVEARLKTLLARLPKSPSASASGTAELANGMNQKE